MIKFLGILLIVAGTSACGFECSSMLVRRARSLEAFARLFDSLGTRIAAFSTPVGEFFASYRDDLFEKCAFFENVRTRADFCSAVNAKARELCLEHADTELLCAFGEGLGSMSAEEEVKRCMYYKNECEKMLSRVREELPVKTKLLKSVGIMCGILTAVLVI